MDSIYTEGSVEHSSFIEIYNTFEKDFFTPIKFSINTFFKRFNKEIRSKFSINDFEIVYDNMDSAKFSKGNEIVKYYLSFLAFLQEKGHLYCHGTILDQFNLYFIYCNKKN